MASSVHVHVAVRSEVIDESRVKYYCSCGATCTDSVTSDGFRFMGSWVKRDVYS